SNRLKYSIMRSGKYRTVRNAGLLDRVLPKMFRKPMQEQTHLARLQYWERALSMYKCMARLHAGGFFICAFWLQETFRHGSAVRHSKSSTSRPPFSQIAAP